MWHTKKLNEVCDIQSGLWKGKKGPYTTALVLRNTNFTASGVFDYSNVVELEVEAKQLAKREVIKNDIILEKSGGGDKTPVGRVCIHDKESKIPFSLSNFTARIRVLDSKELNAEFLHKFLYFLYISGKTEPMQRHSTGIRNLQLTQYKDIDVPLPPLAEQQRIVAKLDAVFAEIDTLNQINSIRKAELIKFKKALLMKTLSIEKSNLVRLGDVCELIYGKPLDKIDRLENDGVPAYGANGIKTYSTKALSDGPSIIIGRKGSAGELKKVSSAFWALDVTYYTKINQKLINLDFLYYTLSNMNLPSMAKGVKPGINRNDVYKRMIYLPSLVEQKRIVSLLDASYKEIKTVNDSLFKLKNNCQTLITAILSQELQSGEAA